MQHRNLYNLYTRYTFQFVPSVTDNGYTRAIANRRVIMPFEFAAEHSEFADITIPQFEFASWHSEFAVALTVLENVSLQRFPGQHSGERRLAIKRHAYPGSSRHVPVLVQFAEDTRGIIGDDLGLI